MQKACDFGLFLHHTSHFYCHLPLPCGFSAVSIRNTGWNHGKSACYFAALLLIIFREYNGIHDHIVPPVMLELSFKIQINKYKTLSIL